MCKADKIRENIYTYITTGVDVFEVYPEPKAYCLHSPTWTPWVDIGDQWACLLECDQEHEDDQALGHVLYLPKKYHQTEPVYGGEDCTCLT